MQRLDGKALSQQITSRLHSATQALRQQTGYQPKLTVISVGEDPASKVYVGQKEKRAREIGYDFKWVVLPATINQEDLETVVGQESQDPQTHGLLLQLPLPEHLDPLSAMHLIDPAKDVDGFHPLTMGKVVEENTDLYPCTPKGILALLEEAQIPLQGQNVVIIGRSQIVGLPLSIMMINRGATVTVCNSKTQDLGHYTRYADILVVATGQAHLIGTDHVKPGAVIVDVGINRLMTGQLVGDVDYDAVATKASYITPVPGGVGPMTVAMLMEQTFICTCRQLGVDPLAFLADVKE